MTRVETPAAGDLAPRAARRTRLVAGAVATLLSAAGAAVAVAAPAAAAGAFACTAGFYQTSVNGSTTKFYGYAVATNQFTQVGGSYASSVNGIGYNTSDNYIYGMQGTTLVKIDNAGTISSLGATTGATVSASGGDFYSGALLTAPSSGNTWASVNVTTRVATTVTLASGAVGTATGATWGALDLTVIGSRAYGLSGTTLYVVDLAGSKVASKTVTGTTTGSYGAAYSDTSGNAYFYNNSDQKVFQFTAAELAKITSGGTPAGVLVGGAASTPALTAPNDGASCALAVSPYAPAVTGGSATSVTAHTVTLNASVAANNSSTTTGFCWSTSPSLSPCTTVTASPSSVTGTSSTAISASLSGLAQGTTYYARAFGTNAVDTTNGSIFSFTTAAGTSQAISFTQPSGMTVGDAAAPLTVSSDSGLDVTVVSDDTSVCTVGGDAVSGWTVTPVAAGTCSLTATQAGDATYAAATPVTRTFTVTAGGGSLTAQAISFTRPSGMTVGDAAAPLTVSSDSGLDVTVVSNDTSICTVGGDAVSGWTVTPVAAGTCSLTATQAGDGTYSAATPVTRTFTIRPPGGGSDPADDTATVAWDDTSGVLVDVLANDPGGATIDAVGTPGHGTAVVESGQVRYTPAGDFAGDDTFTYTVNGSATPATVTVTVTPPDLSAADDEATAAHGAAPVTVDVLANDTGTGLTLTGVDATTAEGGTAAIVDGEVVVTPADGFRGDDTLQYEVTDAVGNTASATVTVHVPNAAPTVSSPAARQVVAGGSTDFALTVGDTDPDDAPALTRGTPTGSPNAATRVTATVLGSGTSRTVRVAAQTAFSGTVDVPVTVDDGHDGGTASTTLHLTVVPRPATGVQAGVLGNPDAAKALSSPAFDRAGNPVSKTLATRLDSRITWQVSPTTSVTRYVVRVNGTIVCQPAAPVLATTQSCTLTGVALRTTDVVTVTALGQAGTASAAATVPVVRPTQARALLAVVYFPVGDFRLDATAQAVLRDVDAKAVAYGMRTVRLEGHTDSDGSTASNQTLSENRARQVGQWLAARDARVRVGTAGFGELRPAVTNSSARNKAANRRVEIYVGD